MFPDCICHVASDIILTVSSVILIDALGVSKVKRVRPSYVAAVLITLFFSVCTFYLYKYDLEPLPLLVYPLMFICTYKAVFGKIKAAQIYTALIIELAATLLSSCFTLMLFQVAPIEYTTANEISLIIVRTAILSASFFLKRGKLINKLYSISKSIPGNIFVLVLLSLVFADALAVFNQYPSSSVLKQNIVSALIAALAVSLVAMIFSLLTSVAAQKYVSAANTLLKSQVETQLRHYGKLEKLNDEMQAFRHDYENHMRSILALLDMKQYSDAERYIEKLLTACPRRDSLFQTGNRLADAILTDKSDLCRGCAEICFEGFIPDRLDNPDLCVILSNALDNAVEACMEIDKKCRIEIFAQERQGYFAFTVKNPTADSRSYYEIPETKKSDAENHGFGLHSIDAIVSRHGGKMNVKCENNTFELSLTFKI